jgi:ribonuclease HI
LSQKQQEAAEILRILAEQLQDEVLAACFPDREAAAVRNLLQETARILTAREPAGLPRESQGYLQLAKGSLFTDGAARGNPGEAGAGILLLDQEGREIAARSFYLGQCTNNVAEYRALILGLREAGKHGVREISIYLDAELVVRQLLGSYQVRDDKLKVLHAETMALLTGFDFYQIVHVPRQENQRADQLANLGIDRQRFLHHP